MIELRLNVLLEPIGVPATYIEREQEKDDLLIGAFNEDIIVGCCVLTPGNKDVIQLRQMAVLTALHGKGVGAAIVEFAEDIAASNGFKILMMHARSVVVDFYRKCGYEIVGDEFEEVGIKHYKMQKKLV
ncbi:MAG: GNAT family N-acetyltransferase [Flavisolibacter sp.]|nr:GNAT family N-acetyltransferase [Flavisolibacter sp.]